MQEANTFATHGNHAAHVRSKFGRTLSSNKAWLAPLALFLGVSALNVGSAWYKGVENTVEAAAAWWFESDAQIPELTARWWLEGGDFLGDSGWSPFDRGPLQPLLLLLSGAYFGGPLAIYVFSVVVNSSWVIGLWAFLRQLGVAPERTAWVIGAVALCGPVWLNTVYPWPKMLAAGLCLLTATFLMRRQALAAGIGAGAAMLTHGSSLFIMVGLAPFAVAWLGRKSIATAAIAAAPVILWALAPLFIAAPGATRLIQWHFAGKDIQGITTQDPLATTPPLSAIVQAYGEAGWETLRNKISNVRVLIGDWTVFDRQLYTAADSWIATGALGKTRVVQMLHMGLAPGILLFGLLGARKVPMLLWYLVLIWSAVFVVLEFGGIEAASTWLHAGPYALLIAWIAALALGFGDWIKWAVACEALVFVGMWLTAPPVAVL